MMMMKLQSSIPLVMHIVTYLVVLLFFSLSQLILSFIASWFALLVRNENEKFKNKDNNTK